MSRENLERELLYRSIHRGCKETDHLIGNFVKAKIADLSDAELLVFKDLVVEDDMLIYDWILNKENPPQRYESAIARMREFHKLV